MSKSPRSHTGPACAHHEFQSGRVKLEERFPEATIDSLKAKAPQNHHHRTLVQQLRPPRHQDVILIADGDLSGYRLNCLTVLVPFQQYANLLTLPGSR